MATIYWKFTLNSNLQEQKQKDRRGNLEEGAKRLIFKLLHLPCFRFHHGFDFSLLLLITHESYVVSFRVDVVSEGVQMHSEASE